jgi:hypothetical protein
MLVAPEDIMAVGQRNDRINDNLFGLIIRCHSCMSNFLKSNISIWTLKHMKKKEYLHDTWCMVFPMPRLILVRGHGEGKYASDDRKASLSVFKKSWRRVGGT